MALFCQKNCFSVLCIAGSTKNKKVQFPFPLKYTFVKERFHQIYFGNLLFMQFINLGNKHAYT